MSHNIDLDSYIQNDYIRSLFKKSYAYVDDSKDIKNHIKRILESNSEYYCLIFSKSYLKNVFFEELRYYSMDDMSILNCNSNLNIFKNELINSKKIVICNNSNRCNDHNITDLIKTNKGIKILVC